MLRNRRTSPYYASGIILFYLIFHFLSLTGFPLMHSDEAWLSGLSRQIATTGNISSTEPFFDLKPRNPHALKIVFHGIQILFIQRFHYSLFSIRLVSLLFGFLTLFFLYKLALLILPSQNWALFTCLLVGIDAQFIYASHFGRQEIILLGIMVWGCYYLIKHLPGHCIDHDFILGILTGASIGIHPNGAIIALLFTMIYGYYLIWNKNLKILHLCCFSLATAFFALLFIRLSYSFDPQFITHYLSYGEQQFKVLHPLSEKAHSLIRFYQNIYLQKTGTYYCPNLRPEFFLFVLVSLCSLFELGKNKNSPEPSKLSWIILAIIAINLGFIIIGRFNTTSIVFLFPFFYLLTAIILTTLPDKWRKMLSAIVVFFLLLNTLANVIPPLKFSYSAYLKKVAAVVSPGTRVLASLNTEYYFQNGKLHDYRNLAYLRKNKLSLGDYIRQKRIQYIIYPEGLDFIYQNRPKWNGVYGQPYYYPEMQRFLKKHCRPVSRFSDPAYGIEIPAYAGKKNWQVTVYQVLPDE